MARYVRKTVLLLAALLLLAGLLATACNKEEAPASEPAAAEPTGEEAQEEPAAEGAPSRETLIKIAVETGCLAQNEEPGTAMLGKLNEIYSRYNLDAQSYAKAMAGYGTDVGFAKAVSEGLANCPEGGETDEAAADEAEGEEAAGGDDERERVFKTALALACLGKADLTPEAMAKQGMAIYERNGFSMQNFATAMQKYATDTDFAMKLAKASMDCSEVDTGGDEAAAEEAEGGGEPAAEGGDERDRVFKATVALACLGKSDVEPEAMAKEAMAIYERHGFTMQNFATTMQKYTSDTDFAMQVAKASMDCSKVETGGDEAAAEGGEEAPAEAGGDERERALKAAIEIGCLAQAKLDPQEMMSKNMAVYERYGFTLQTFPTAVQKYASDRDFAMALSAGITKCAEGGDAAAAAGGDEAAAAEEPAAEGGEEAAATEEPAEEGGDEAAATEEPAEEGGEEAAATEEPAEEGGDEAAAEPAEEAPAEEAATEEPAAEPAAEPAKEPAKAPAKKATSQGRYSGNFRVGSTRGTMAFQISGKRALGASVTLGGVRYNTKVTQFRGTSITLKGTAGRDTITFSGKHDRIFVFRGTFKGTHRGKKVSGSWNARKK